MTHDSNATDSPNGSKLEAVEAMPYSFIDRVPGGSPPELIREATDALDDRIIVVWPYGRWFPHSMRLFDVCTAKFGSSIFMEKDGHYLRLDASAELIGINEVLREYPFTRKDFDDPCAVSRFLGEVIRLRMGNLRIIPTGSRTLPGAAAYGYVDSWLQGTEKSEAVLRELCRDPELHFEGNKWKVTFNTFNPGGSVDQWKLIGRHDPQANANEILQIEVTRIKPMGTFSYW
jgi:hypothetical protein